VLRLNTRIREIIDDINSQEFVFYSNGDDLPTLNKVMLYIRKNEQTKRIKIAIVLKHENERLPAGFKKDIEFLDREYPEIDIEFVTVLGEFGPKLIRDLSKKWKIPVNFMFIGSPGDTFPYKIEELGGVRLII
jgi:hypothetical protein